MRKTPMLLRGFLMLSLVALAFVARPAAAQIGGAAVVFLMIEPDSRAAGMGNAGVAVADNANALFWNPAGLADQVGTEAALTHSNWLPELSKDLFFEYLVGKHNINNWGTIGAHVTFLNLGEHEHRDALNNSLGTFKSYDFSVGVSWGFKASKNLSLGTGVRWIQSNLASVQVGAQQAEPGMSVGVDVAMMYKVPAFLLGATITRYNLGFNLANMGPKIQYSDSEQSDPIPTFLRVGHAFTFEFDDYNKITLANDFSKILVRQRSTETCLNPEDPETCTVSYTSDPFYKAIFTSWAPIRVLSSAVNDDEEDYETLGVFKQLLVSVGFEYWYNDLFAARGGYFYENPYNGNREFLTFGAGIRYNIVGVDFSYIYALEENHPLANTMRFSLLLNFAR
ncbi:MAG: type IX secretion system outer membrane channel protein PorV [Bacteroidota bacterium]|nr:type IX secretion system outer membrane channel protein PorV [Bacteroidota bacterium]MDE2957354.1 type IX secretion system outer membrane channel protein PorV [Bacteroidota bacterium]